MSQPQSNKERFISVFEIILQPHVLIQICITLSWFIYLFLVEQNGKITSGITNSINKFWIDPITSNIKTGGIPIFVFVIFFAFLFLYLLYKYYQNYIFSARLELFGYFILLDYLLLRIMGSPWKLAMFSVESKLAYFDLLTLILLTIVVFKILQKNENKGAKDKLKLLSDDYCEDESLIFEERRNAAQSLSEILFTIKAKGAYAIGIISGWGNGKTTFIRYLEKQLENKNPKPIIIRFEPWYCKGSDEIIDHFFKTLSAALSKYHGGIESKLKDYTQALLSRSKSSWVSMALKLTQNASGKKTASDQFDDLNQIIPALNRKIFIEMDDLDRLLPDELMECFRIVRNTASFENVVYLLSYDKAYVKRAIRKHLKGNFDHYIEKIVQMEYRLPELQTERFRDFLVENFKKIGISTQEITKLEFAKYKEYPPVTKGKEREYELRIWNYFENVRDCVRVFNCFLNDKRALENDATDAKLFMVCMLKTMYPEASLKLCLNMKKYFHFPKNVTLKVKNHEDVLVNQVLNKNKNVELVYEIEALSGDEKFQKLVKAIFTPTEDTHVRVNSSDRFIIYYNGVMYREHLDKDKFESITESIDKILSTIRKWRKSEDYLDAQHLIHLKNSLVDNKIPEDKREIYFYALLELVEIKYDYPPELSNLYDLGLIENLIEKPNGISLLKISNLISSLKTKYLDIPKNTEYKQLHIFSINVLNKAIDDKSKEILDIYWNCYTSREEEWLRIDPSVNERMKVFAKDQPEVFLTNSEFVYSTGSYRTHSLHPAFSQIFSGEMNNYLHFGKYLQSLQPEYEHEIWFNEIWEKWTNFTKNDQKYIEQVKLIEESNSGRRMI